MYVMSVSLAAAAKRLGRPGEVPAESPEGPAARRGPTPPAPPANKHLKGWSKDSTDTCVISPPPLIISHSCLVFYIRRILPRGGYYILCVSTCTISCWVSKLKAVAMPPATSDSKLMRNMWHASNKRQSHVD